MLRTADYEAIRANIARRKLWDHLFAAIGLLCMLVAIFTLLALFLKLLHDGSVRLTPEFIVSFPSRFPQKAGILAALVGTALVMLVTAFAAVLLGVAAGIYLEEYAPKNWITDIIEINVTNLAGVPSIVYGLLALGLFVYRMDLGESILTAGLTLALLILPVIILATREAIRAVPQGMREAAYAVGATRWQVTAGHVVPYAGGGILTGIIIGLAEAIGETAPVITIGALTFIAFLPSSPFTTEFPYVSLDWLFAPFTLMPIQMFAWVSRPEEAFQLNAAAAGAILFAMTVLMNALAFIIRYRFRKRIKW